MPKEIKTGQVKDCKNCQHVMESLFSLRCMTCYVYENYAQPFTKFEARHEPSTYKPSTWLEYSTISIVQWRVITRKFYKEYFYVWKTFFYTNKRRQDI